MRLKHGLMATSAKTMHTSQWESHIFICAAFPQKLLAMVQCICIYHNYTLLTCNYICYDNMLGLYIDSITTYALAQYIQLYD